MVVELSSVMFVGLERGEGVFALLVVSAARGGIFTSLTSCLGTGWRLRGADGGLPVLEVRSFLTCRPKG